MEHHITLHQFYFSNFCEKANWALDYKGITANARYHLPFLHSRSMRKLSGQTSVPVMEIEGKVIAGSSEIIDELEQKALGAPLYPNGGAELNAAQEWQSKLDQAGATFRGAMFYDFMQDRDFMFKMLTAGQPGLKVKAYKLMFNAMFSKMGNMLRERAPDPDALRSETLEILDAVAETSRETGYLVGSEFSVADLSASALLYPLFFPTGTTSAEFVNSSEAGMQWISRWKDHAAGGYVRRMYSAHRNKPMIAQAR